MEELKYTGGARLGITNVTAPFATLSISPSNVILNASLLGNYYFLKEDIVSFEPHLSLSAGIKINHKVPQYNKHLIFWTPNAKSIIEQLNLFYRQNEVGDNSESTKEIRVKQEQGALPLKKSFAISIALTWLMLFGLGLWISLARDVISAHLGVFFSFSFIVIIATCLIIVKPFRRIILKENRKLSDINRITYFIIAISLLIATMNYLEL